MNTEFHTEAVPATLPIHCGQNIKGQNEENQNEIAKEMESLRCVGGLLHEVCSAFPSRNRSAGGEQ